MNDRSLHTRYMRWAEAFNRRLASDMWEDDPYASLTRALIALSEPDPFPGTNAEWQEFFHRALDRFEEAHGTPLDEGMRVVLETIHPCRETFSDTGYPRVRFVLPLPRRHS